MRKTRGLLFLLVLLTSVACAGNQETDAPAAVADEEELSATNLLTISSSAFGDGEAIPERYTCEGDDAPPPLTWQAPPEGTASFALIMDDPDAPSGTWVHWVLYDIPAETRELAAGGAGISGENSWGREGYGGPCPPAGSEHRYFFKLFALDTTLSLEAGADKEAVLNAIDGHVLAEGQLMGIFAR